MAQQGDPFMLELLLSDQDLFENDTELSVDQIARLGAQKLLKKALIEEVNQYIQSHKDKRDEHGRAMVVGNGKAKKRTLLTGSGEIQIEAPRVNDRRPGEKFCSKILPPYMRKTPNVESVLPILYLKGLSANAFSEALEELLGEGIKGLSKSSIHTLKKSWESDMDEWKKSPINDQFVYLWADGVHVKIRLGEDKSISLLVVIGVNQNGEKKLLAVDSGYRESEDSWRSVFLDLQKRGLNAPLCIVGDGALGLWACTRKMEFFKQAKEQRCWFHKMGNILNKLPKRLHSRAKSLLQDMMGADKKSDAQICKKDFEKEFTDKHPKAVECLLKDWDKLTSFFDFPGAHWCHIKTTNPIESMFATVKLRTRVTKGSGSRKMAETMAFKLMKEAEKKWRKIRKPEEVKKLLAGELYKDGKIIESKHDQQAVA